MTRTRLVLIAVIAIIATSVAGAALAVNKQDRQEKELMAQLYSQDWETRAATAERIIAGGTALSSAKTSSALINLLESENQLVGATYRESGGREGVTSDYTEEYAEYYSKMLGAVWTLAADTGDARALKALARAAYNPDSQFAMWLATNGDSVAPTLLEMTRSDLSYSRENAAAVLGEMTKSDKMMVSAKTYEQIKQALVTAATSDSDINVKAQAIHSLGKMGDKSTLGLLESISGSESETFEVDGELMENPIKGEAQKAINAIEKTEQSPEIQERNIESPQPESLEQGIEETPQSRGGGLKRARPIREQ